MLPDRVSNPGPLTYESGALPTALRVDDSVLSYSHHFRSRDRIKGSKAESKRYESLMILYKET